MRTIVRSLFNCLKDSDLYVMELKIDRPASEALRYLCQPPEHCVLGSPRHPF